MEQQLDLDQEGCLLWAKLRGYCYWPGVTTVDPMGGQVVKANEKKKRKAHVHFLGYDNLRSWIPEAQLLAYKGIEAFKLMAAKAKNKKDFFPTKKYQTYFDKAVQVADSVQDLDPKPRLEKLGLVYVLIEKVEESGEKSRNNLDENYHDSSTKNKVVKNRKRKNSSSESGKKKAKKEQVKQEEQEQPPQIERESDSGLDDDTFMDEEPLVSPPKPKKAKMNSTTTVPLTKKAKMNSTTIVPLKVSSCQSEAEIQDLIPNNSSLESELASSEDDDDSPNLGSLVWGRMAGFPYWPCFVTKGPDGRHKRGHKRAEYHVQFFNWNNESGWVSGVMPWCPIDEYKALAKCACPKGPNTPEGKGWYPPSKLAMKWKDAVLEAQRTASMTRRERYNHYVVHYDDQIEQPLPPVLTVAAKKHFNSDQVATKAQKKAFSGRKGCPLSKKKGPKSRVGQRRLAQLPPGWDWKSGEYHSPEKQAYGSLNEAMAHLFRQNCGPASRKRAYSTSDLLGIERQQHEDKFGWFLHYTDAVHFDRVPYSAEVAGTLDGKVEYLRDHSLPAVWSVKKVLMEPGKTGVTYQSSSTGDRFTSKLGVARFLEGMGHPAVELEQLLHNFSTISFVAPEDPGKETQLEEGSSSSRSSATKSSMQFSINLNEWSVAEVSAHPWLGKAVVPCNVDMVKLPEVFLSHPEVRVREAENEMVITDYHTDEFIAKKIMYE